MTWVTLTKVYFLDTAWVSTQISAGTLRESLLRLRAEGVDIRYTSVLENELAKAANLNLDGKFKTAIADLDLTYVDLSGQNWDFPNGGELAIADQINKLPPNVEAYSTQVGLLLDAFAIPRLAGRELVERLPSDGVLTGSD